MDAALTPLQVLSKKRWQRDKYRANVRSDCIRRYIESGIRRCVFDSIGFEGDLIHPADGRIRSFQARSGRELADDYKISDVLLWDEACGHPKHLETRQSDKSEVD